MKCTFDGNNLVFISNQIEQKFNGYMGSIDILYPAAMVITLNSFV